MCQVSACRIWLCPHKSAAATTLSCIAISISAATCFTLSNGSKVYYRPRRIICSFFSSHFADVIAVRSTVSPRALQTVRAIKTNCVPTFRFCLVIYCDIEISISSVWKGLRSSSASVPTDLDRKSSRIFPIWLLTYGNLLLPILSTFRLHAICVCPHALLSVSWFISVGFRPGNVKIISWASWKLYQVAGCTTAAVYLSTMGYGVFGFDL